jgi:type II secretory pathway component PulC
MLLDRRFAIPALLLTIIVLLLGYYSYQNIQMWSQPLPQPSPKETAKKPEGKGKIELAPLFLAKEGNPAADIQVISEKNIFSPERKEFSSQATDQGKSMTRPQVVLYGVLIGPEMQMAIVVNPGRTLRKGERDVTTVKLGERLGEYKLAKVMADRIVLEAPGDSFEVLLIDPKAPKKRTEVRITPVQPSTHPAVGVVPSPMVPPAIREGSRTGVPVSPSIQPRPIPRPIMPSPVPPGGYPRPVGPTPQIGTSSPMPGPQLPSSIPQGTYRGRRYMGYGTSG